MIFRYLSSSITSNLIGSAVAAIFVFVISSVVFIRYRKKHDDARKQQRFKYRIGYVSSVTFILILIRIWVEGFTHLFAMLSLIAASLVVTNKESIMNITGFLIINWRGIFSVGDFVQLQNISGYIDSIKLFNFKIMEIDSPGTCRLTGRSVKVPNSSIITAPIIVTPGDHGMLLQQIVFRVRLTDSISTLAHDLSSVLQSAIHSIYEKDDRYIKWMGVEGGKVLSLNNLDPQVYIKLIADNKLDAELVMSFYCHKSDLPEVEESVAIFLSARSDLA